MMGRGKSEWTEAKHEWGEANVSGGRKVVEFEWKEIKCECIYIVPLKLKTRNPPVKQHSYLKISWDYHPTEGLCSALQCDFR